MSVRDAFVVLENYNISSELNEINDDDYVFLRYEILPHNDSFKVILLTDGTKICSTPSDVESDTVVSDEMIIKVDALYDAISNGAVKISDLTITDHATYSGTFYLNKDISSSNIVVTLFKDNDDLTSDFNIVAQPTIFLNRRFWKYDFIYSGNASYSGVNSLAVYVDDGITTDTAHVKIVSPIVAVRHYVLNIDGAGLDLNPQNIVVNDANEPLNIYNISGDANGENTYLVYLVKNSFIPNSTLDRIRFEVNGMAGGFSPLSTTDTLYTRYFENLANIDDYTVFISNNPNLGSIILHIFAI